MCDTIPTKCPECDGPRVWVRDTAAGPDRPLCLACVRWATAPPPELATEPGGLARRFTHALWRVQLVAADVLATDPTSYRLAEVTGEQVGRAGWLRDVAAVNWLVGNLLMGLTGFDGRPPEDTTDEPTAVPGKAVRHA